MTVLYSMCVVREKLLFHFYTVPTPPWNLTVTRQCPYTWVLSWNEPNFTNVDIIGFQIRFIAADSPTRYLDVAATSSESSNKSHKIDLYGLNMSQEHSIQVSSVGIEGLGNYSEIFYFFPQRCSEWFKRTVLVVVRIRDPLHLYSSPTSYLGDSTTLSWTVGVGLAK